MARRKPRRKKTEDEHTHLSIRVERHEARAEARIDHDAYGPQYAFDLDDRNPLYRFVTDLTITGSAIYPENRAGDVFEVMLWADNKPYRATTATLQDVHARDEKGLPQYRKYRGQSIPVYAPPPGIAPLHKVRGEARWTAWINVPPQFVGDLLNLLGSHSELYVGLHEVKEKRSRWVRSFSLQTTDPSDE